MPPPDGTPTSTTTVSTTNCTTTSTTNAANAVESQVAGIQNDESRSGSDDVESSEEEQRSPQDLTTATSTNGTVSKDDEIGSDESEESKSPIVTDDDRVVKVDSSSGTMAVNEESVGAIDERLSSSSSVPEPEQESGLDLRSNGVKRRLEEEDESIESIPSASGDGDLSRGSNTNESNSIDGNVITTIGNKVTSSTTNGNGHNHDGTKSSLISSSFPSSFLTAAAVVTESNSIGKRSNADEMIVDSSEVSSDQQQSNGMNLKRIKTATDEVVTSVAAPIHGGLS